MSFKKTFSCAAAALLMFVPAPGRLAAGVLLALEFDFLAISMAALNGVFSRPPLEDLKEPLLLALLVSIVILLSRLFSLFVPDLALQLGFAMYLPAVSSFLTAEVSSNAGVKTEDAVRGAARVCAAVSVGAVLFFLLRDVAGFGTITYFGAHGMEQKVLFDSGETCALTFLATIPGALLMAGAILSLLALAMKKIAIAGNSPVRGGADD